MATKRHTHREAQGYQVSHFNYLILFIVLQHPLIRIKYDKRALVVQ
jgi:hypothetical protein